ncbi:cobalamin-independent methionine synthase II family protein [Winkia sp. UMB0889B]|uniref:cobalamin-independent methionine synthase II family protein n=1 Tax=Winkia sp. UMB0889B TaxID=3046315 RepID=UPI002552A642|nr:cobalamin-independent methionine synthase II family protein [Winkia sp. UMB0889B]MDK7906043.1 cobalamin-independent methionine synthase II family protein [Winkia sp. UMB0889B]
MTKIETTHVGSLPRTSELLDANKRRSEGRISETEFAQILTDSVQDVVRRQKDIGIDIVNEGEYGHITSGAVDYGAWWNYSFSRMGGLTMTNEDRWAAQDIVRSEPGKIRLTSFPDRRDRAKFRDAYEDPNSGILGGRASVGNPKITGPLTYTAGEQVGADIDLLTKAMKDNGIAKGFIAALSPGSAARIKNEYYATDADVVEACADVMAEEYKAIAEAGLTVQLDAPDLAESWDQINPEPTIADYQKLLQIRIDAINKAISGIAPEQVRLHICWGSWHGPHTTDIPFEAIIEQCLQVNAGQFSFEGSSPRHAHEWKIWKKYQLPAGRKIVPGVVCHSTNVVEHPELVAERIIRFAEVVGPENVIASTDCGLGGRVHSQIAWAKLEALAQGAEIASERLF